MRLLRRWSFWTLALGIILAAIGPHLFRTSPDEAVAPPFVKPIWLAKDAPPSLHLMITKEQLERRFLWEYEPPLRFSLKGAIRFGAPPEVARIMWETPKETIVLYDASKKAGSQIDLDARDVSFKLALGLSPFQNPMLHLFPVTGEYALRLESSEPPDEVSLALQVPGNRWGLLGTDQRGRDVFHLFVLGIRVSLLVGLSATFIATALGLAFGLSSGYFGGIIDAIIMRAVDVLLSIPTLPIMIVLAGLWGKGLFNLILILSAFSWMSTARTVRSMTLSLREATFVEGLRALGAPSSYILWRHLLPEALPLLLANIALGVPGAVLAEAGLSFLGLSDPRLVSWGRMLHEAHSFGAFTSGAWWLILPPGFGIAGLCLVFLDLGRHLEEILDPRLRRKAL
jgi:peptide/nickel transport system permease protein